MVISFISGGYILSVGNQVEDELNSLEANFEQINDIYPRQCAGKKGVHKDICKGSIKYGVNERLASEIIRCESGYRPEARNTKAKVGVDIGYWQLNSYYWEEEMLSRGWDIYNPVDNLEAGFWLLAQQGSTPWNWSKHCWN